MKYDVIAYEWADGKIPVCSDLASMPGSVQEKAYWVVDRIGDEDGLKEVRTRSVLDEIFEITGCVQPCSCLS